MVFWKNKKYHKRYAVLIRRFVKDDKIKYQFVINSRYKGLHLWHSQLYDDLVSCAFEGFKKVLEAEEDEFKAFNRKPKPTEEEALRRMERQERLAYERRKRKALGD